MAKVRICFYFYANFTKVCYDQREFAEFNLQMQQNSD